jgi:hypothetical protein
MQVLNSLDFQSQGARHKSANEQVAPQHRGHNASDDRKIEKLRDV